MADSAKFAALCKKSYADQAQWFLNGFWKENNLNGAEAEKIWEVVKTFTEFDSRGATGNELNEFDSHRVLEKYDQTLSAIKMREALREIDQDNNKHMSAIEYFIWHYKKTVHACVTSPQGDNQEKIAECQRKIAAVQTALADVQKKSAANQAKLKEAAAALQETNAALRALEAKERELEAAEAELKAAIAELKAQEDAYNNKIAELEKRSTDTSVGLVTRNKAANELAQLKGEDPLPLRKAKITQEAALRKVGKVKLEVQAQKDDVAAKKKAQEAVENQLKAAQAELDAAERDLETKMAEAEAELQKAKDAGGISHGNLWWMGRTLYEADKSLARAKQKYDHSKPFPYSE